jgi:hypothetical protein
LLHVYLDQPPKAGPSNLAEHEEFREQYARAREENADRLFEECLEIADNSAGDIPCASITKTSNARGCGHTEMDARQAST